MSFDPSRCNLTVNPFPTDHLLIDPTVPDPLGPIQDCVSFDLPVLFPEALCPQIVSTLSTVHFTPFGFDPGSSRVDVAKASDECFFNFELDLNPPCLEIVASGRINYVPFSQGVDARLTADTRGAIPDSISLRDACSVSLFLEIDIPAQPCPSIYPSTAILTMLPPGEEPSLDVLVTKVYENGSDSINNTDCAFAVELDLKTPCTLVTVEGSDVTFSDVGGPAGGSIRMATLSAIPCELDFRLLLDLKDIIFEPITLPAITDLCIDPDGKVQSAEVSYYTWPTGEFQYSVWRTQFGYCDENACFSTPVDFGLFNTGCGEDNRALDDDCLDDPHWTCEGDPAKSMKFDAYPAVWMRPGRRSRWIARTCSGIEPSSTIQTFATTLILPGTVTPGSFAVEGVLDADNWVREIRVNGVAVPIPGLTDIFPGTNNYRLQGPLYRFLLKAHFLTGVNTIEFDVDSSDIPGGLDSWLGFRLEWTGVGICNSTSTTTTTSTSPFPGTTTTTTSTTTSTTPTPTTPIAEGDCLCIDGEPIGNPIKVAWTFQPSCSTAMWVNGEPQGGGFSNGWFPDPASVTMTSNCISNTPYFYNYGYKTIEAPWHIPGVPSCYACVYGPNLMLLNQQDDCSPPESSFYKFPNQPSVVAPLLLCTWNLNMRMGRIVYQGFTSTTEYGPYYNFTIRLRVMPLLAIMPKRACYLYPPPNPFNSIYAQLRYTLTFERHSPGYAHLGEQLPSPGDNGSGIWQPDHNYDCRTTSMSICLPGPLQNRAGAFPETKNIRNNFMVPPQYQSSYYYEPSNTDLNCNSFADIGFGPACPTCNICVVTGGRVTYRP
jgi:hypothetical protein